MQQKYNLYKGKHLWHINITSALHTFILVSERKVEEQNFRTEIRPYHFTICVKLPTCQLQCQGHGVEGG